MGMVCRLCGGPTAFHLRCGTTTLLRCARCGVRFLQHTPPQKILDTYYQEAFYDTSGKRFSALGEFFVWAFRYERMWRVNRTAKKGNVLDVGFSRGIMLSLLKRRGWHAYGITNSRNAFQHARTLGIRARCGSLLTARYPRTFFSTITFWHVLEHVREPEQYVRESSQILKQGGSLIIEVPNAGSPIARWFGCQWLGLDLPRHLHHFTPQALRMLLERYGLRVEKIQYFSLEHSVFSLLQSLENAITGKRNLLLESMKRGSQVPVATKLLVMALTVALLPFATFGAAGLAATRRGDIMRMYAVKR